MTALLLFLAGCATPIPDRSLAAKTLFNQTVKECHLASAEATGAERDRLLREAAAGYERVLRQFPEQEYWCAQALRSLGNVRVEQGQLDVAVKLYRQVGEKYPRQDWEVLQAWKSAGDLLWEAGRKDEARQFYRKIVQRFDQPEAPAIYRVILRSAQSKLP